MGKVIKVDFHKRRENFTPEDRGIVWALLILQLLLLVVFVGALAFLTLGG